MKNNSIMKNSLYNMLYKGLNVFFPLITVTYVSRILLATGVGKVSTAQNYVQYFITLAALGIPNYGIREIAKNRAEIKDRNQIFSELFAINLVSTLLFSVLYYGMILIFDVFEPNFNLHLVVGISVVLNIINVDWYYQGIEEYGYIALRSFCLKLLSLILIIVLIRKESDYIMYAAINCIALGGNYIWNVIHLRKSGVRLSFKNLKIARHMKPIMILLGSVISIELYTLLDTTMISAMCEAENVAYYTNSMKLIRLLITMVTSIGAVLLPRLSYYHKQGMEEECSKVVSKIFLVMLFIFIPCEIGIFMISDNLAIVLFGESFAPAGVTLRIASLLICTLGFSNLFGTQVLLTYGREKLLLYTTIIGAVSNISMNAILIPLYQQNGAAVASVISETLVTGLSIIFALKFIKIKIDLKFVITTLLSSALLVLDIYFVSKYISNAYLFIVVAIITGGIVYALSSLAIRNPIIDDFFSIIKKKK